MKDREQVGGLGKPPSEADRQESIAKRMAKGFPGPRGPEPDPEELQRHLLERYGLDLSKLPPTDAGKVLERAFPGRR